MYIWTTYLPKLKLGNAHVTPPHHVTSDTHVITTTAAAAARLHKSASPPSRI